MRIRRSSKNWFGHCQIISYDRTMMCSGKRWRVEHYNMYKYIYLKLRLAKSWHRLLIVTVGEKKVRAGTRTEDKWMQQHQNRTRSSATKSVPIALRKLTFKLSLCWLHICMCMLVRRRRKRITVSTSSTRECLGWIVALCQQMWKKTFANKATATKAQ